MPTLRQLQVALKRADQQGDEEAVRVLAQAMSQFIEPPAPMQEPEPQGVPTAPFSLKDTAVAAGQGVVGVGKTIADVFGADNAVSQSLGKTQEELSGMYSPARQKELAYYQDQMEKAKGEGALAEAKVALQGVKAAPIQSAAQAVGSIVPNLATLLIPGVGVARAGIAARAAANTAIGVIEGAGAVKGSIYDNVYNALKKSGMSDEEAAQTAAQAQSYMGENLGSIVAGGGLGYVAGRTGLEELLAPTAGKAVRKLGAIGSEFLTEGVQGGQEQLAANLALQKQGFDTPTMEGVAGAATQEGLLGAIGAGVVSPFTGSPVQPQGGTPPATPPAITPAAPTAPAAPQDAAQAIQAVQEQIAATTAEPIPEPTVRTDVAPPSTPAAPRNVIDMMDEYKTLNQDVDQVLAKLQEARKAGDLETLKALLPEFEQKKNALEELRMGIEKQGGGGNKDQFIAMQQEQIAALDKNLKAGDKRLEKAIDNGDAAAASRITAKLEELKQKRQEAVDALDKGKQLFRIQATPKGQTPSLFEPIQQANKEVVKPIEAGAGPLPPEKEKRVRGTMQPDLFGDRAKEEIERQRRMRRPKVEVNETMNLFPASETPVIPRKTKPVQMVNAVTGRKMGKVTPDIKAGPVQPDTKETRVDTTQELYSDFNLLRTATLNGDQALLSRLHRENEDAARRKDRRSGYLNQPSASTETEEAFKGTVKGIKRYEKVLGTREYTDKNTKVKHEVYLAEEIANDIAAQRKKMEEGHTTKDGVYKRSMMERLHDLAIERILKEKELAELKAAKADPAKIAKAKVKLNKAKNHLEKQLATVKPHVEALQALQQAAYKVSTPKTEAEKQAEVLALGKSNRVLSDQAVAAKTAEVSEDAVAEDLGMTLPAVKRFYTQQTKIVKEALDAFKVNYKKEMAKVAKVKKQFGETSDEFKKAEAETLKAQDEAYAEFRKLEKETAEKIKARAIEKGRESPDFEDAVQQAQAEYAATAAQQSKYGKQTVKSLRTKQVTREINVLKKFPTGSTESRAQSAKNQAAFEEEMLDEETGNTREYERKQELVEMGKRAAKKPSTAMAAAMTKAAADVAEARAREEEGKYARGVEVESPNLTKDQVTKLEEGKLTDVLNDIHNDPNTSDLNRAVAKALADMLDNTRVEIKDVLFDNEGKEVLGEAISTRIMLSRKGGLSQEVLLHEGTHAAVERVIQLGEEDITKLLPGQQAAFKELRAIHNKIKRDPSITSSNAKGSLSEFAAEVLSNRNLQKQLRNKPWRVSDALRGFVSAILRMLNVKNVDTMLGASIKAVDALMIPSSVQRSGAPKEIPANRGNYSAKDIAALHTGSNSMRQFAEQFGPLIKQPDRKPEDVDRIAMDVLFNMQFTPENYVKKIGSDSLDYARDATMPDGKVFDVKNPIHYITGDVTNMVAAEALKDSTLRNNEANAINKERLKDFDALITYIQSNPDYTLAEQALVAKAAAQYSVISGKDGRLKLVNIDDNNRHSIAVVGHASANAVIEELRAGKSLKQAFLDGLQKNADVAAKENKRKQGWQKFNQSDNYEAAVALNAGAAGTTWCTGASMGHATNQIKEGDFYIYYQNGKPEVAVRMSGKDKISEVRGNTKDQGLTPEQIEIATKFLNDRKFKNSKDYTDAFSNKQILKEVVASGRDFTPDELYNFKTYSRYGDTQSIASNVLDFGPIYGHFAKYASQETKDFVAEKLDKSFKAAAKQGYLLGKIETDRGNKEKLAYTIGDDKVVYEIPYADVRAINSLDLDKTMADRFPNLEYVIDLSIRSNSKINLPKLKQVYELELRNNAELTLPDGAVVDYVKPSGRERATATIHGKVKLQEITLNGLGGTLDLIAPEAVTANVRPYGNFDIEYLLETDVARNFKDIYKDAPGLADAFDERVVWVDGDSTATGKLPPQVRMAYAEYSAAIAEAAGVDRSELREMVLQNLPTGTNDTNEKVYYFSSLVDRPITTILRLLETEEEKIAFARKVEKAMLKLNGGNPLKQQFRLLEKGSVYAPNAVTDDEFTEAVTIEPEVPRYARSDDSVGVFEKAKGAFGFRAQTQPSAVAQSFVAQKPAFKDTLIGNVTGLTGRVQFVDKDAALSAAFKEGLSDAKISDLEAQNAEYFLRFGQNRSQYATQFLSNGPVQVVETKTPNGVERIYKSTPGANMLQIADAIAPSKVGNDTEKEAMLTALVAGERAKALGWDTLNVANPKAAEAEYNSIVATLKNRPDDKAMFDKAMDIYRQYNAGLLDFLVQTGAMKPEQAARLKSIPYVPYYRVDKDVVELIVSGETPIRIGNLRDQPELHALVGDARQIQPIFTSAIQNTFMITQMGLRNQSIKESAFTLMKVGIATRLNEGMGPDGPDTVRFFKKGEQYHVVIDKDLYDIPADLIVKGMEGIKTSIPAFMKMLGIPANILRQFVTRNPAYAVKQAIRDPLTAWMTTGTDGIPVLNAFKELGTMVAGRSEVERQLMASGAISSNVITGDEQDMAAALRKITSGKAGWAKIMAQLDAFAMQGDAATRAVVYKDSLNKGMTEQQALLRTLESMNFGRRGLSPSIQMLSTIIPFFNAQIQGLDVLYRAFKGDMPYSEKLNIQRKLMARGLLMAVCTMAYAAAMGDDDRYKRAKPEERLGNWFVPNPFSEELMRIPVPFELGYLFKSLPEAVMNASADDKRNEDITKGMGKLLALSNPLSLPQAVKPLTEVYLGKSFYGGDIESQREQKTLLPTERYRDGTTEVSKLVGSVTGDAGLTAIKLDHLVRGYTGPLGVALVSMVNPILRTGPEKERPTTKTSQLPFIGGLFQPDEGRGTLDAAFATMLDIQQAKGTYKEMMMSGNTEGAEQLMDRIRGDIALGSIAGGAQQRLGEFATIRRNVLRSQMSQEQKDEVLKRIDTAQNTFANAFLDATERTRRQLNQP
jgi:hypothetical protein